jgi:hypothetical protein
MFPKTLPSGAILACGVLAVASLHLPPHTGCPGGRFLSQAGAAADEKKDDKPILSGTWVQKDGELTIEYADKGVLKIAPHGDSAVIAIVCDYTVEKEGLVKAKVTGHEGKEEAKKKVQEHVPVGFKFTFTWKVDGDAARLDDVKGDDVESLKSHLEGDFKKKK